MTPAKAGQSFDQVRETDVFERGRSGSFFIVFVGRHNLVLGSQASLDGANLKSSMDVSALAEVCVADRRRPIH
ncbi:hypothetical protein GGQ73_003642 [Rhizobium skierniewicense]|uniref:Uncharacterized protein n=1 Tax=Rhizobium skierniewicense TaxID=984260 RepID=A0A7W6G3L7_9HYPH|nr:hypothetical protein [Rhizobium skierniewicense]MBB3947674.1 hypothetical protein [Rhizobium skierniewicense]